MVKFLVWQFNSPKFEINNSSLVSDLGNYDNRKRSVESLIEFTQK